MEGDAESLVVAAPPRSIWASEGMFFVVRFYLAAAVFGAFPYFEWRAARELPFWLWLTAGQLYIAARALLWGFSALGWIARLLGL